MCARGAARALYMCMHMQHVYAHVHVHVHVQVHVHVHVHVHAHAHVPRIRYVRDQARAAAVPQFAVRRRERPRERACERSQAHKTARARSRPDYRAAARILRERTRRCAFATRVWSAVHRYASAAWCVVHMMRVATEVARRSTKRGAIRGLRYGKVRTNARWAKHTAGAMRAGACKRSAIRAQCVAR